MGRGAELFHGVRRAQIPLFDAHSVAAGAAAIHGRPAARVELASLPQPQKSA